MNIQEMRYKEVLPDKTVKRLKKILKEKFKRSKKKTNENGIDFFH